MRFNKDGSNWANQGISGSNTKKKSSIPGQEYSAFKIAYMLGKDNS